MKTVQNSEPFAPGESRFEIMPEFNVVLVRFPTKKDLTSTDDSGEINQPAIQVFDENLPALKFNQKLLHVRQGTNPVVDRLAANIRGLRGHLAQTLLVLFHVFAQLVKARQPLAYFRQQCPRFLPRVMFFKTKFHFERCPIERVGAFSSRIAIGVRAAKRGITAQREELRARGRLRLPRALLVTMHAQLLTAFVTVNLCLAAFFE